MKGSCGLKIYFFVPLVMAATGLLLPKAGSWAATGIQITVLSAKSLDMKKGETRRVSLEVLNTSESDQASRMLNLKYIPKNPVLEVGVPKGVMELHPADLKDAEYAGQRASSVNLDIHRFRCFRYYKGRKEYTLGDNSRISFDLKLLKGRNATVYLRASSDNTSDSSQSIRIKSPVEAPKPVSQKSQVSGKNQVSAVPKQSQRTTPPKRSQSPTPLPRTVAKPAVKKLTRLSLSLTGDLQKAVKFGRTAKSRILIRNSGSYPARNIQIIQGPNGRGAGVESIGKLKNVDLNPGQTYPLDIRYWPEIEGRSVAFHLRANCDTCDKPSDLIQEFQSRPKDAIEWGPNEVVGLGLVIAAAGMGLLYARNRLGRKKQRRSYSAQAPPRPVQQSTPQKKMESESKPKKRQKAASSAQHKLPKVTLNLEAPQESPTQEDEEEEREEHRPTTLLTAVEPARLTAASNADATVYASLSYEDGQPAAGCNIRFSTSPGRFSANLSAPEAVTAPDGIAEVRFMVPSVEKREQIVFTAYYENEGSLPLKHSSEAEIKPDMQLQVDYDSRLLDADGKDHLEIEVRLSREDGSPVTNIMVEAEAPEQESGTIEPAMMVTDTRGGASFAYTTSKQSGRFQIRLWPRENQELEQLIEVEQQEPHFFQAQLEDLPSKPVARVYLQPGASQKHNGLLPNELSRVEILNQDLSGPHPNPLPPEAWRTVALIGTMGYGEADWPQYSQKAREFYRITRSLRESSKTLMELRGKEYDKRCWMGVLSGINEAVTAAGILAGIAGITATVGIPATILGAASDIKDVFVTALEKLWEYKGVHPAQAWERIHQKWSEAAHDEIEQIGLLANIAERLHDQWLALGPNAGPGQTGWQVVPIDPGLWGETEGHKFYRVLLKLLDIQAVKCEWYLADMALEIRLAGGNDPYSPVVKKMEAALREQEAALAAIMEARDDVSNVMDQAKKEAQKIDTLTRAMKALAGGMGL